jgi:hypothetical protein
MNSRPYLDLSRLGRNVSGLDAATALAQRIDERLDRRRRAQLGPLANLPMS